VVKGNGVKAVGVTVAVLGALALGTLADVVHLRDGTAVEGRVAHLGGTALVLTVPGRGNLILPWEEVSRVEFTTEDPQPSRGGSAYPSEVAWNNAMMWVRERLAALNPVRTLLVDLGLTWVAVAVGSYLEDHCGSPACCSLSCTLAVVGVVKTVWDVFTLPKRREALAAEVNRLRVMGQAYGYVFRGCYVKDRELWAVLE